MRPGVDVISRALPPPRSAPTDTGVAFIIGATPPGVTPAPPDVELVRSMTEFVATFGDRSAVAGEQATYDAADAYFHEGGAKLYVARSNPGTMVTLSSALPAHDELERMTRAELDALATDRGIDPAQFATKADVLAALEAPALQVADPGIASALANLTKDLGPGQVLIADATLASDVSNQSALLAHAVACNRVALLSCADGNAAALEAAGQALQTDANARYGALFAPTAVAPGVVAGTTRTIPYAAVEAGIIARNDAGGYSPNVPAAGELGQTVWALDVNGRYTDLEYQDLNEASVNMARLIYGGVRTYGYRSCVDPDASPQWRMFGWCRLNMAIVAEAEAIGERYVFRQLDGQGHTLAEFGGELSAMLAPYFESGSLYGRTAEEAYDVDVGSSVNTPETIANGELHAVISVRMSPDAEWVVIEIVKVASNQALPATATSALAA
jgi:hypothetical protein